MRTTQRKGDAATARAVASFTALGMDVAIPLTESAGYDLIVDCGSGLRRVQCKFTARSCVDLRRIHCNTRGYVVKGNDASSYDWLYILRGDGSEYLVIDPLGERRQFTPQPEHLLGAVAESGRLQLP